MTRGRALAVLAVALLFGMSPWLSATAVIPQLREEWELSSNASAWLTIAVQLGFVAGALLSSAGNVADVLPPRLVILAGSAAAAAANLAVSVGFWSGSSGPVSGASVRTGKSAIRLLEASRTAWSSRP